MKKLTIMSALCFVFLLTNAQTISIIKIEGTDTISIIKEIDNRFTEITLSNGKVKHQRIVAFDTSVGDIAPSRVTTMFYDNTILSFLIHHQGKNYSYCLVTFDGQKWDTKTFKGWKDVSILYGV